MQNVFIYMSISFLIGERTFMNNLYKKISKRSSISESDVLTVLRSLNDVIIEEVDNKGFCKIPGLGTFTKKEYKSHAIRNVHTGEKDYTTPSASLSFKATDSVKKVLNSGRVSGDVMRKKCGTERRLL